MTVFVPPAGRGRSRRLLGCFAPVLALLVTAAWSAPVLAGTGADPVASQLSALESKESETPDQTATPPVFGLPPIVAQVFEGDAVDGTTKIFKVELVFDEVDHDRIMASQSVAKSLQPRLMDRVIRDIQGSRIDSAADPKAMQRIVLASTSAVLKPYGVVLKSVNIRDLSVR